VRQKRIVTILFSLVVLHFYSPDAAAQQPDRFQVLQQRLLDLSQNVPALNQLVETSISNGTLKEFLRGLAETHNLNLNIDPTLNQPVTSYFANERLLNVLLYLAKEFNLDFAFTGSIISIMPYKDPLANQPRPPKELQVSYNEPTQLLTMDLQNDTLLHVARKITQVSGKNVIVMPALYSRVVTTYVQGLTVESALEKLAISNSFKLNKTNDGAYIIEPLDQNEQIVTRPTGIDNPNYSIRRTVPNTNPASASSYNISNNNGKKLITLNITNTPIIDVIKNITAQAGIDYFIYSELLGNATANVQNMEFDRILSYILQGTKYTYNVSNGVYMIGDRQNEGLRAHQLIQLRYRSVDSLLAVIPMEMRQGVDIKEFKELNSFLLSGSQPQIKEIEEFVHALDKTVPMVLIEVILMDIRKSKTIETGIKLGVSDSVKTGGTLLGGLDFTFGSRDINRFIEQLGLNNVFNIGRVSPNFYASLKALETNANVDLRQTPKLSTLNGHSANLSIGSTRYYLVKTQNVLGSLNPSTIVTEQYVPVEANLYVNIKPFVSGDEQVTLNINVDISDFIGAFNINAPPPSASSKFESIIRVRNEEMIVLGGIERNEKSDEGSGTPFLSRIPILKWLFSSRKRVDAKTVSVVFIKPTIIY
jgi:type IV pilus assembly protein PilQ